jgi:hypothetical protein
MSAEVYLLACETLGRIHADELSHDILEVIRSGNREVKDTLRYLSEEITIIVTLEGIASGDELIDKYSHGPVVGRFASIWGLVHDFRAHIGWRSTVKCQTLSVGCDDGETEVNELDVEGSIQKDVLKFEITMYDVLRVEMSKGFEYLLAKPPRLFLIQAPFWMSLQVISQ